MYTSYVYSVLLRPGYARRQNASHHNIRIYAAHSEALPQQSAQYHSNLTKFFEQTVISCLYM
jgi:hypothetical protein